MSKIYFDSQKGFFPIFQVNGEMENYIYVGSSYKRYRINYDLWQMTTDKSLQYPAMWNIWHGKGVQHSSDPNSTRSW